MSDEKEIGFTIAPEAAPTTIPEMDAPELWGIDPDAVYEWSPQAGRVQTDPGEWDADKVEWVRLPTYGEPKPGCPIFLFRPLLEATAIKLETARQKYRIARAKGFRSVAKGEADAAQASDTILSVADSVYTPELIAEVLRGSLAGWRNLKNSKGKEIAYTGEWKKDEIAIRRWAAAMFNSIVEETIFERVADSFTSAQDLPPA